MAIRRNVRIPTAVCDANETDGICDINIQVKVAGVDLKSLSSAGKVFRANGREHPMSRFGSWVFQESSASNQARQVCTDGGIIASLTWGLLQSCPQAELWVNDIAGCCFTMQLDEGLKVSMLEHIAKGDLAKELEHILHERIPRIYKDIRIRLIKILGGPGSTGTGKRAHGKKFLSKSFGGREFERISGLMQIQNYQSAYAGLKQMIDSKSGYSERVLVLIRLGICCFHLEKDSEIEDIVKRLLRLTENMEDCSPPLDTFIADLTTFAHRLEAAGMSTYSINILLGCNEIIRKIEDSNDRLHGLNSHVHMCSAAMMNILLNKPSIKVRAEFQQYFKKLEKEVQYMKMMEGCDELKQWRAVYYSLHALNNLRARMMGEPVSKISARRSVMRFACAESSWADFTRVLSLGIECREIELMFISDASFVFIVSQISENPALLEKLYADPRIRKINTLLNRPFYGATPMSGFTRLGLESEDVVGSLKGRKERAKKEKKKGDDAFEKMEYENALRHYDKAIEIDPTEALHHSDKAEVLIRQNQLDKAEQSCLTAMRIVQSNGNVDQKDVAKIIARYAHVEFLKRRYDAALELYHKSLRLHDDINVRQQMRECEEVIIFAACMSSMMFP